jgi:manganese transport protein
MLAPPGVDGVAAATHIDISRVADEKTRSRGRRSWLSSFIAALGPGYLIAVGYMDPGNWVTDISAGAKFGFDLLAVILFANLVAILVQSLAVRLAIGSGLDLAQACRKMYPRPISFILFLSCQIAIVACDLAEVIGTAIAFNLLFHLPIIEGALLSSLGTIGILCLQKAGRRPLEVTMGLLVFIIAVCLFWEVILTRPSVAAILSGYIPHAGLISDMGKLYLALGIIGATVMPHNLYLHGALTAQAAGGTIGSRKGAATVNKKRAFKWSLADTTVALSFAFLVNSALLIVAAAFHSHGRQDVNDLGQAYTILSPLLGTSVASLLFGIALLVAGQASTVTATLAGQVSMKGFLDLNWHPWLVRLLTRTLALAPVILIVLLVGDSALTRLLIFSQVVLSIQLPFAVVPLIHLCGKRRIMGELACSTGFLFACALVAALLIGLNIKLLIDLVG